MSCSMFQGIKTFLNRPRKSWSNTFLGTSWQQACHTGNLILPVPAESMQQVERQCTDISDVTVSPAALCLGSDGGTSVKWLPLNLFAKNKQGEIWVKLGVLTVYPEGLPWRTNFTCKWMQNMRLYWLRVIFKTAHFWTMKFSSWNHRKGPTLFADENKGIWEHFG